MTNPPITGPPLPPVGSSTSSRILFGSLLVLQLFVSAGLAVQVLFFQFAFDACGEHTCDYELGNTAMWVGWLGILFTAIATVVTALILGPKGRRIWWIPLAGTVLALGFTVLSCHLTFQAAGTPAT